MLARLHQAHLLSEKIRLQAVERMAQLAVETPDAGWLHLPAWKVLLRPEERSELLNAVRTHFVSLFDSGDYWFADAREEDDPVERALLDYQRAFEDAGDPDVTYSIELALDVFRDVPTRSSDYDPDGYWDPEWEERAEDDGYERRQSSLALPPTPGRSIFDDIDR